MLRVASVPGDHPYVRHLAPATGAPTVLRLPDPPVPGAPAGQWWPSPVLTPAWLRAHAGAVDVVHVHFGVEHLSTAEATGFVGALVELRLPLVLTLHDLECPHLSDQRPYAALLDVLVPAAAAVVTLTSGAAREARQRWGVEATVLPHPHVVPLSRLAAERPAHDGWRVALHDKAREGNDPEAVRTELVAAVASLGGELVPSPSRRLSDDELWDRLEGLDVLVLAYRAGTHSGFVEACHDLGTTVVAPAVGHWHEQQRVVSYDLDVPGSLTSALQRAHAEGAAGKADPAARAEQRDRLARAHERLYAQVAA